MEKLQKYHQAKDAYYAGSPIMTDADFDALELLVARDHPEILKLIGATERTGKETLPVPMGSLDQCHTPEDFERWKAKFPAGTVFVCTEKLDGNSAEGSYKGGLFLRSFSRGDGLMGANNTRHTQYINFPKALKERVSGHVRGELIVSKKNWQKITELTNGQYKNARNFTAGFLNATTSDQKLYPYIDFVVFDFFQDGVHLDKDATLAWLADQGFKVPRQVKVVDPTFDQMQDLINTMIAESEYELDGVVVDVNCQLDRDKYIDPQNLNPNHARKIKPPSKAVSTTVTKIEWQVSKDGLLKPVVVFDPVELTGVTITRASGYNAKNVVDQGMGVGAIVCITRQGDVIPRVDSVLVSVPVEIPEGAKWDASGVELLAEETPETLRAQWQKEMEYFFSEMEVDFMGSGNVAKLAASGDFDTFQDVIHNRHLFEILLGENGRKAALSFSESLKNTTPAQLFAALGLFGRGMGQRKLSVVFAKYAFEDLLSGKITKEQLTELDGFEDISADKILQGVAGAYAMWLDIKSEVTFVQKEAAVITGDKFKGKVVCATGVRLDEGTIAKIEQEGGTVTESFGKSVTLLIAKDPSSNSGKAAKARSMGIEIISLAALQALL